MNDRQEAAEFLAARFGGGARLGPDLPQGEWSRAYAFSLEDAEHVLRFNRSRAAFDIDLAAMRFASPSIPIPAVTEVGEAPGGHYAISQRVRGAFLEELDAIDFERSLPSLLDTLDAMRITETSGSHGFGPWDADGDGRYAAWADYLMDVESEVPGDEAEHWRRELEESPTAWSAFEAGTRELAALVSICPNARNVVHSDLLNRNVFVSDHRISGLIDWQCAMYGDFLYDLAWLTFWAPWHPALARIDYRALALVRWGELPAFADRMRCYEIHIGLRHLAYNAWRRRRLDLEATAKRTREVIASRM